MREIGMKMNQRYRPLLHCGSVFVFLAVLVSGCGQSANNPGPTQHGSSANNRAAITISKATTYVTEPLNADGYPDYIVALNQIASEGVRPEENAAVILANIAIEPSVKPAVRAALFEMLGTSPP